LSPILPLPIVRDGKVKGTNMSDFNNLFDSLVKGWESTEKSGYPTLLKDEGGYCIVQLVYRNNLPSETRHIASGDTATEAVLNAIDYLVGECDREVLDASHIVEQYNRNVERYVGIRNELVMAKV